MRSKIIRYSIVILCVIAILFALVKVLTPSKKLNTYLVLGDYLSVSGNLKGETVTSFSSLLGDYFISDNLVEVVNSNYSYSSLDSASLLEMITKDSYSGKDVGLVSSIEESKYITISVGMNDILGYIRFDSNKQSIEYDEEFIKRKLEILKQNYYEIVEEIKEINGEVEIYITSYYCPFTWVDENQREGTDKVFMMLNDSIKEISSLMDVYYVDISEVAKDEHMFNKYQIYLNQMGHEYVFSVFKNNYFS